MKHFVANKRSIMGVKTLRLFAKKFVKKWHESGAKVARKWRESVRESGAILLCYGADKNKNKNKNKEKR